MKDISLRKAGLGISLISMATLMLELLVNKALSFSTWGSLGYMIIGSAIFGFSIAGVVIAIWQPQKKYSISLLISYSAITFSISVSTCYIIMNLIPFNFENIFSHTIKQIFYFTIWYLSLLVPFSMTGFIIVLLLMEFKDKSNRLYAADLIGAGLGCIIVVPLFPLFGASGQYLLCAALGAICAIIFSYKKLQNVMTISMILLFLFIILSPFVQSIYPVKTHQEKRRRGEHFAAGYIQEAMWSFLSKIEVAIPPDKRRGMIWFDGGLMQSAIDRFDGNYEKAKRSKLMNQATSIPYQMKKRKQVLIIAPAGGRELRASLVWGAEKVIGVELDYSVVKLVKRDLNKYLGGIFNNERVKIINDEGRSFVRRSKEKYDVIQFISAYSVTAIQSGAVDLSSSYLMTEEAFEDYLQHLTKDGILHIARDLNLRLFFTAWSVLEKMGLDPSNRIALLKGATLGRNTLLVKLEPFEPFELETIKQICLINKMPINYAPSLLMNKVDNNNSALVSEKKTRMIIEMFIKTSPDERESLHATFPYKTWPVIDDKPFYDNIRYLGKDVKKVPKFVTEEVEEYTNDTMYVPMVPIGYVPRIVVLSEAVVFALLFLIFPLWMLKSDGISLKWQKVSMLYFLSLGLGFIWIEIVLLKKFILFLGSPVYSIAVILFAMLISAGLGSLFSERLTTTLRYKLIFVASALISFVLLVTFLYPLSFRLCLGFPLIVRIFISVILIAPIGFILGIPFPVGLHFLSNKNPETIAWAWAVNGYATVVGVSTSAFLAMQTGFAMLLWISVGVYLFGFVSLFISDKIWIKSTGIA